MQASKSPAEKNAPLRIASLANPRVKNVVKLRKRAFRDEHKTLLIEGYRELLRAVENGHTPEELFVCRELFLGSNEPGLIARCAALGARILECAPEVFAKMAYRDRPDGLLALAPYPPMRLENLDLPPEPLLLVAEAIEKPGNLGTLLRTADAAGVDAVLVCDPRTDVCNPNVVRASIGTLFCVPVAVAGSRETMAWLRARGIRILAATPHAETLHTGADWRGPVAVVVGAEQYGLQNLWLEAADCRVRIPMRGQADSLNVAAAATILVYEALRQRQADASRGK